MKKTLSFLILATVLLSCTNQSELSKKFNCNNTGLKNASLVSDFKKNFRLNLPTSWKKDLYYDNFQSELFVADTTKQLTDTFILGTSFNSGKLNFDETYYKKNDSILIESNLQKLNFGNILFQSKPAFWYVAEGSKNNFKYHTFNLVLKLSENTYFNAYSEIYGEENIEDRICKSIAIIETVEFL